MINKKSIEAVEKSIFSEGFIKPLYESYCFLRIPHSIAPLLTGKKQSLALPEDCMQMEKDPYDVAVFLFLDGFGWKFFERHKEHPFLQRFLQGGIVSKLTAQFPSTTSAEVTTVNTGLEVGQSGIYEWFQYEPKLDRIVAPLLFSYAGDPASETLLSSGLSIPEFLPFDTIYQKLHLEGATSYVIQPAGISDSAYCQRMTRGSHLISYLTLDQGIKDLREILERPSKEKMYVMLYYPNIDSVGHRKGVSSQELDDEIIQTLDSLESGLATLFSQTGEKVAMMLSADHGMSLVDPHTTVYINQACPEITSWIKKGFEDRLLTPAGSCRDFFLHIQEEYEEKALSTLKALFHGKAEVWKVADLISLGLFGQNVSRRFIERVGNVAILPFEGESVWWYERHKFEQHFKGAHGGLTRSEMEIPFLFRAL